MTSETDFHVVVIGASHAGAQAAHALRRFGWTGKVTVVGDEPVSPYHRPPLSKDYLKGRKSFEQILIRPPSAYAREKIDLVLGKRVEIVERGAKSVTLSDGTSLVYDKLIMATGASPRRLPVPGVGLEGVCYVRTIADIERMRAAVKPGGQAFVIGGGYIGLEAAASLRALQMNVAVLEAQGRILQRVTCPVMSTFFTRVHEEEGVRVHERSSITAIHGDRRVAAVELERGVIRQADLVVIGIGIVPNTELAERAGLEVDNGVVVDEFGRTRDPDIYASGDCTRFVHPRYGRPMRLECVQHANDQAAAVARALCGVGEPYDAVPWFWSDQFDVKLQIAGLSEGHDDVVQRGDSESGRSFSLCYVRDGRLLAVDAVNRAKDFITGRKLVAEQAKVDPDLLADPNVPLEQAILP